MTDPDHTQNGSQRVADASFPTSAFSWLSRQCDAKGSFTRRPALTALAALALLTGLSISSHAQAPLSLGSVANFGLTQGGCPNGFNPTTTCYSGTIQGCTNGGVTVVPIDFTYGVLNAGSTKGTIVFFNGSDGTDIGFNTDAQAYSTAGFQTIQVIWQSLGAGPSAWELAGAAAPDSIDSIKYAACRPATLLHWIRCGLDTLDGNYCMASDTNIYQGGGMCAEGASAGSAAIAYSMAEYEADDYLDNVEFMSGPPLSDISKGCAPSGSKPPVCTGTGHDSYCHNGGEGAWQAPLNYQWPADSAIDFWTGLISENQKPVACTTSNESTYDAQFKTMSIVDGDTDSHFSYPHTSMTGWLCAYSSPSSPVCANETYPKANNSPAEGELFYTEVSANPLNVYRVDGCASNSEDIEVPSSLVPALIKNGACPTGQASLQQDMINRCIPQPHSPRHR